MVTTHNLLEPHTEQSDATESNLGDLQWPLDDHFCDEPAIVGIAS